MSTIKDQIIASEERLMKAVKNGDVNELDALIHDGLLFVIPNGQTATKEMDLQTYRSGNMFISDISASDREISVIEDNAIVTVIIDLKGKFMNQQIDGKYRYIRVWKSFEGQWRIIAGSCTQLQPA